MSKRKKILILGVTGQDGSFMAKYLMEKKYQVHGLVRKSATGNLKNIKNFLDKKNFFFYIVRSPNLSSRDSAFRAFGGLPRDPALRAAPRVGASAPPIPNW